MLQENNKHNSTLLFFLIEWKKTKTVFEVWYHNMLPFRIVKLLGVKPAAAADSKPSTN